MSIYTIIENKMPCIIELKVLSFILLDKNPDKIIIEVMKHTFMIKLKNICIAALDCFYV